VTSLSQHIHVRPGYLRSTNVEQDAPGRHYIPTGRALDVLGRINRTINGHGAGHAWSLTGPYGSGKSSFAVFLRALLGPEGAARSAAEGQLRDADKNVWSALAQTDRGQKGFVLATTTCQAEPVVDSVLRGLTHGVEARWGAHPPGEVRKLLKQAVDSRSAREIAAAVAAVTRHAPLLLLLDEFGKTLEHFAGNAEGDRVSDLFVLQELAEQKTTRHPLLLLTLQHLAFDDYVRTAPVTQRREWGKIAGRFEDVPFVETSEQSLRLVAGALEATLTPRLTRRLQDWSAGAQTQLRTLALQDRLPGGRDTVQSCYPLHPIALLALPALCARLGQHGRTLFTFLASDEASTLASYLDSTKLPAGDNAFPTLDLASVYDFFTGPGRGLAATSGPRWSEIDTRIQEAQGLPEQDVVCLKTVGLLNLLADAAGLRASAALVSYALSPADQPPQTEWVERLDDLEARGWLTYRNFADEYRLWQGSDVDLRSRVADAREQLCRTSMADLITRLHTDSPIIAGKHTQRVGMLRYFSPSYADATAMPAAMDARNPADGTLIYYLDDPTHLSSLPSPAPDGRPVLLATSTNTSHVRDAAVEAAAALHVLEQQDVAADRVARRELQDRVSDTRRRLATVLELAFRTDGGAAQYHLLTNDGLQALDASVGLSRMLSDVCDDSYSSSPEIRNEMLGRRELTSQGAKARRNLLEAMVTAPHAERLGLVGYGPERAMYEAVLHHTGLHQQLKDGTWAFDRPNNSDSLTHAWGILTTYINAAKERPVTVDKLYARLKAPPIGVKDGPLPVLLTAMLLNRADDVGIYQEGTYQPTLTADLLERLLKAPDRFALKAFELAGPRAQVLEALLEATGLEASRRTRGRNATVLRTAAPLLALARDLPPFTRKTRKALSGEAERVRDALLSAREPDVLLFEELPTACGLPPVTARRNKNNSGDVERYAVRLAEALKELQDAYRTTLYERVANVAEEFNLSSEMLSDVRVELRVRTHRLAGTVLEPTLSKLLFHATGTELDDEAWLEGLCLAISGQSPSEWTDDDVTRFDTVLHEVAGSFARVEALHIEAAAARSDGFTAQRVTITTPGGHEVSGVVWMDDHQAEAAAELAAEVEAQARRMLGGNGARALLAALARRQLDTTGTATTDSTSSSSGDTTDTRATRDNKEANSA